MVLDRFHRLSEEAGVPRITVHDLRHLAATITITAGIPLTVVSKSLRHSTESTTASLYSCLTRLAGGEAFDTIGHTLTRAERTTLRRPARLQHHGRPTADDACDHHTPGRAQGRPLMDERTASDLRFRTVGTTGFEPATP
ncbi:tyrosine-type recombinase/integrase [Streptomyces canus]|uniref:tyrosine-type recombinase/integrase n=1 Tax=Streptomyces canus TaxID=58343 RepID=UPI00386C3A57